MALVKKQHYKTNYCSLIILTDLDGTLLDAVDYSYKKAMPGLEMLRSKDVPLIFCSSKTYKEQMFYIDKLKIGHPFIVENGGALYIPKGYFPFELDYQRESDGYHIIVLGTPYPEVTRIISSIRQEMGINVKGFADMSVDEVAAETSLDMEQAKRARQREYDESLIFYSTDEARDAFLKRIKAAGLNYTRGGRFWSIMGSSDKGRATETILKMFKQKLGSLLSVGVGDSLNDLPMLKSVDIPYLVKKVDNTWEDIAIANLRKVNEIGPIGWVKAIMEIAQETGIA